MNTVNVNRNGQCEYVKKGDIIEIEGGVYMFSTTFMLDLVDGYFIDYSLNNYCPIGDKVNNAVKKYESIYSKPCVYIQNPVITIE